MSSEEGNNGHQDSVAHNTNDTYTEGQKDEKKRRIIVEE